MSTLTAKYIDAVTRALPEDRRAGVAEGLRDSVARTARRLRARDGLDPEAAEYAAVAALGDPERRMPHAADARHFRVPPRRAVRILAVVLLVIVPCVGIARIATALSADQAWDEGLSNMLFAMLKSGYRTVCIFALAWFLIEALTQVKQSKRVGNPDWTPEDLPG